MSVGGEISILSYNIHKGFDARNRNLVLGPIRDGVRALGTDIVFLQEVLGQHDIHAKQSQFEYLAEEMWEHHAYGQNAIYDEGHHGNAILSDFPFTRWSNSDISHSPFEYRGMLHGIVQINQPDFGSELHLVCLHLGLFGWSRRRQLKSICEYVETQISPSVPLILAGDFNDLFQSASKALASVGLVEVFEFLTGTPAASFPSRIPVLRLDRIYVRGLKPLAVEVHHDERWAKLSDHLPLSAKLQFQPLASQVGR